MFFINVSQCPLYQEVVIKIEVKDNNVDQALRILKRKLQREGFFRILKIKSNYEKPSEKKNIEIIIAGAGGAAHLAGVAASITTLPVFGIPIESKLKGLDSLLSTVQMPSGIPVGTLAIGKAGAINAALLAVSILSTKNDKIRRKLIAYRNTFEKKVPKKPF